MTGTEQRGRGQKEAAATTTTNAYLRKDRRNSMRYRLRRQTRPHLILAGLWTAAAAGHVAGRVAGDPGLAAAAVAAVAAAGGFGAWLVRRRRRSVTDRQVAGWATASVWLVWVTITGPGWTATAVLLVGGYAASLRWWRRWRLPDPPADPPPPAPPDPNHPPRLWARHIGCDGGPLSGSHLTGEDPISTGLRYDAPLVPGKQTLAKALTALAELRTGLRLLPAQDLVLERHPTLDESVILVTIVRESKVLTAVVPWPGPTYNPDTGRIPLGPYVDGEGVAEWLLHTPGGLWGGFLAGSTGSGKSRMLEIIALNMAHAGCAIWYADPQGGTSSPFLAEHADHYAADLEGIGAMLQQAKKVKQLRQVQNALRGWTGWNPDQDRPGLVIIIDECHGPFEDRDIQAAAAELAREGRKVGISLVLASQLAQQDVFGKHAGSLAEALRSSVCTGNMLILQSMTYSTKSVLPGVNVDPTQFPAIPGYAYLIDRSGQRRSAPLRGYFLPDETWQDAAGQVTWRQLDQASGGAAGKKYTNRRQLAQQRMEKLAEREAALARGEDPDDGHDGTGRQPAAARLTSGGAKVIPFPSWRTWQQHDTPQRRTAVEVIHHLIGAGVTATRDLQARSGYGKSQVHNALRELAATGRVRKGRHGVYEHVA